MTLEITDELRLAFKAHYGDERGRTADANRAFDEFAAGWQARDAFEMRFGHFRAEPVAWMLRPIVQRHPSRQLIRDIYSKQPTPEEYEFAKLDGDEYVPLYLAPSATE